MSYEFYVTPDEYLIAEKNGIKNWTVDRRVQGMGWHKEKAITTPPIPRKSYGSWIKIAKENGINACTFRNRVNVYGFDMETAATKPLQNFKENMKLVGQGNRVYPQETIELAAKNGICYNTFLSRMNDGWSIEDAVKSNRRALVEVKGWKSGPSVFKRKGVKV